MIRHLAKFIEQFWISDKWGMLSPWLHAFGSLCMYNCWYTQYNQCIWNELTLKTTFATCQNIETICASDRINKLCSSLRAGVVVTEFIENTNPILSAFFFHKRRIERVVLVSQQWKNRLCNEKLVAVRNIIKNQ